MASNKLRTFLDMIKFEHSIFALPFAYLGLVLATDGLPSLDALIWVSVCMVALRTAAMSLNRLIDQDIDRENPRTRNRALPTGQISRRFAYVAVFIGIVLFVWSAARLNSLCLALSPVPIALVWIYPYLKRWTWLSHWVLGLTLGLAPYGGWLAVRPDAHWVPSLLAIAVCAWVGGFDIFYSLQDVNFDRERGLSSVPVRFGVNRAVLIATVSHGVTIVSLLMLGVWMHFGLFYFTGLIIVGGLIYREHFLVNRFGISKIDQAFFNMNAWVSVVIFLGTFLDVTVTHG